MARDTPVRFVTVERCIACDHPLVGSVLAYGTDNPTVLCDVCAPADPPPYGVHVRDRMVETERWQPGEGVTERMRP